MLAALVAGLLPVLTALAADSAAGAVDVVDVGGRFAAGVGDAGGWFAAGVGGTGGRLPLGWAAPGWLCCRCRRHRWQIIGTISGYRQ